MCKSVCLISFRCLLTVSYSVQSTWCTVPTSSPSPSLLRHSTMLYSPVISSVHSLLLFPPERTSLYIHIVRWSSHDSLSQFCFSGLGAVKNNQGPTNSKPSPPTSVQIICDQPRQLASTRTTDTEVSNPSVAAVERLEIAGQDKKIFDQYCGQIYARKGKKDCRVHFVITKNLDAHRSVSVPTIHTVLNEITIYSTFSHFRLWRSSVPRHHIREDAEMSRAAPSMAAHKPHVSLEHEINLIQVKGCSSSPSTSQMQVS